MSDEKPQGDLSDVRRIVALMKQHDLVEVEWEPGRKIRVVRAGAVCAAASAPVVFAPPVPA